MLRSATSQMLPPRPPSPPSGPPRGTNFSRLNEAEPLPPSPAITSMYASSLNFMASFGGISWRFAAVQHKALGIVAATMTFPCLLPFRGNVGIVVMLRVLNHQRRTVVQRIGLDPNGGEVGEVMKERALRLAKIEARHTGAVD